MATIFIRDLLLRTEVGFNAHEIGKKQDLLLNIAIHYELAGEQVSDDPNDALDYRTICKSIIDLVEGRKYQLLETVAANIVQLLLAAERVRKVEVTVDKPHALRFAQSVAVSLSEEKK